MIVVGALVLAYQGIDYTRESRVLDVGSVHLTAETHERNPSSNTWRADAGWRGRLASHGVKQQVIARLRIGTEASNSKGTIGVKRMRGIQSHKRKGDLRCYY